MLGPMRATTWAVLFLLAALACAPPQPPPPQPPAGTLEDPVPPGQPAEVGGYEITVLDVVPDGSAEVQAENPDNPDPPAGRTLPLIRLRTTRVDDNPGLFVYDMTFAMVAPDGAVFDRSNATCGYVPDDASYIGTLQPGDSREINVCRTVRAEDLGRLRVWLRPFREPDDPGVYFALPPA
jgi:hypothetical protein